MRRSHATINQQVADAVAATDIMVVGNAPAVSLGSMYQTLSNSVSMGSMNAVFAQQQGFMTQQAATVQGIVTLFELARK